MEGGIKRPLGIDDWIEHTIKTMILERLKVRCKKCKKISYLGSVNLVRADDRYYSGWKIVCPHCEKAKLYWTKESVKKIIARSL